MITWITKMEDRLANLCLTGLSIVIVLQVFMRYVLGAPLVWVDEVAIYLFIASVYLGASIGVLDDQHFRVTVLVDMLPARLAHIVRTITRLGWLGFSIVLVWQGSEIVAMLWTYPYISPALGVPQQWPYLLLPIGFALMALKVGVLVLQDWRAPRDSNASGAPHE